MKRALLGTLWIGAVAAGLAIALQMSGLLVRPAAALGRAIGLSPNDTVGFGNFFFLILLSFAVAWTMLQVTGIARQAGLFVLLILELLGAAWVLHAAHLSFPPLPAILAATGATLLALGLNATRVEPAAPGDRTGFCRPSRASRHRSPDGKRAAQPVRAECARSQLRLLRDRQ